MLKDESLISSTLQPETKTGNQNWLLKFNEDKKKACHCIAYNYQEFGFLLRH